MYAVTSRLSRTGVSGYWKLNPADNHDAGRNLRSELRMTKRLPRMCFMSSSSPVGDIVFSYFWKTSAVKSSQRLSK
jgi:hypothetical protein